MAASTVAKTRKRPRRTPPAPQAGVQRYRFTPDQFEQLGRLGLFDQQRVELIGGEIVQMPPVGPEHSVGKTYTASAWQRRKQPKWHVRIDDPLRIGDSEPVPDVAIVPGKPSDYRTQHPTTALLIIEIADTSLEYDRTEKMSLYAAAGIPEYWIVNLVERCVEVYRSLSRLRWGRRSTRGIDRCATMGWTKPCRRCLSRRWRYPCVRCWKARSKRCNATQR
jgi:Uma2 family endonuclease